MDKKINKLRRVLRSYEKSYKAGKPEVSDQVYDDKLSELEQLEAQDPDSVDVSSPTQSLDPSDGKVEHMTPMLSLQKSKSWEEFLKFDKFIQKSIGEYSLATYVLQPKFDGVAVSLLYRNGLLARAITRGDGTYGRDITEHIKCMHNIPKKIINCYSFTIRGEIVISKDNFNRLEGNPSNPRNTVAGVLNGNDPEEADNKNLEFIAHTFGDVNEEEPTSDTIETLLQYRDFGFKVADSIKIKDLDHLKAEIKKQFEKNKDRKYECDGLVVKVNEYTMYYKIKDTAKYHKFAIAVKPKPSSGISKVKEIIISKGKTGKETPVAIVEPLVLDNVTIQKVNLYNADNIKKLNIKVGSEVEIIRSNGVIPVIRKVL